MQSFTVGWTKPSARNMVEERRGWGRERWGGEGGGGEEGRRKRKEKEGEVAREEGE